MKQILNARTLSISSSPTRETEPREISLKDGFDNFLRITGLITIIGAVCFGSISIITAWGAATDKSASVWQNEFDLKAKIGPNHLNYNIRPYGWGPSFGAMTEFTFDNLDCELNPGKWFVTGAFGEKGQKIEILQKNITGQRLDLRLFVSTDGPQTEGRYSGSLENRCYKGWLANPDSP